MSLDIDCDGMPNDGPAAGQVFRDLGVEPIINCTGVRTSYGGCNPTRSVQPRSLALTLRWSNGFEEDAARAMEKMARVYFDNEARVFERTWALRR